MSGILRQLKNFDNEEIQEIYKHHDCSAYFLPRNTVISDTEKYVTVGASYVIVLILWLVLRKKEELQRKRREEEEKYNNTKKL